MGTPPLMVDILPEIAGVDFNRAWRRRVVETIDVNTGLKAAFISADDLIAAKVASGRAQDLADVEAIRESRARAGAATKQESPSRARKAARRRPRE
jgi:hypothetical protein